MSCKQHWVRFDFILSVFKQMTAYEVRISDWSSDVCSSDLRRRGRCAPPRPRAVRALPHLWRLTDGKARNRNIAWRYGRGSQGDGQGRDGPSLDETRADRRRHRSRRRRGAARSEEHTSELQSLMRTSYAVCCLKNKNTHNEPRNK